MQKTQKENGSLHCRFFDMSFIMTLLRGIYGGESPRRKGCAAFCPWRFLPFTVLIIAPFPPEYSNELYPVCKQFVTTDSREKNVLLLIAGRSFLVL